jgi:hypothetical protein
LSPEKSRGVRSVDEKFARWVWGSGDRRPRGRGVRVSRRLFQARCVGIPRRCQVLPTDRSTGLPRAPAHRSAKTAAISASRASVIFSLLGFGSASSVDAAEGCQHLGGACVPALCSNSQRLADRSVLTPKMWKRLVGTVGVVGVCKSHTRAENWWIISRMCAELTTARLRQPPQIPLIGRAGLDAIADAQRLSGRR